MKKEKGKTRRAEESVLVKAEVEAKRAIAMEE